MQIRDPRFESGHSVQRISNEITTAVIEANIKEESEVEFLFWMFSKKMEVQEMVRKRRKV